MADVKDIIEDVILKEVRQPLWENWYIREKLGSGAFAIVYRVEAQRAGRIDSSALKIEVVTSGDQVFTDLERRNAFLAQRRSMVENETNMMVDLRDCPYVVRYEDETMKELYIDGQFEGYYYLIRMELLTGITDLMKRREFDYGEENIRKLAHDIGSGLSAAHAKGIIHRDIKPGNFFVSEAGTYKLGDFNIAKQAASTRSFAGTDYYMAPEVFRAKTHAEVRYTKQADIYSLGICLYQMMNRGLLPFEDSMPTEDAIDKRLSGATLPPPSEASPEFARIILRACECNTAARYRTIDEMLTDLRGKTVVETTETVYERDDLKTTYLPSEEMDLRDTTAAVSSSEPVIEVVPSAAAVEAPKAAPAPVKAAKAPKAPKASKPAAPAAKSGVSGLMPNIKPKILIGAVAAALLLFFVVFFSINAASKNAMLGVADTFVQAMVDFDTDKIGKLSANEELADDLESRLDFSAAGPYGAYGGYRAAFFDNIAERTECEIQRKTAKVNLMGNSGSVEVIFFMPDYSSVISRVSNYNTTQELMSNLDDAEETQIKCTLKLAKVDGKWIVTNAESITDDIYRYTSSRFTLQSPFAVHVTGTRWYGGDTLGSSHYTNTYSLDLDLQLSSIDVDYSGVYYTVVRDGVELYRSDPGEIYGYYGYSQDAVRDDENHIPAGNYEIIFYDENGVYIASDTCTVVSSAD